MYKEKMIKLTEKDGTTKRVRIIKRFNFDCGKIVKTNESVFFLLLRGNSKLNLRGFKGYVRTKDMAFFRDKYGHCNKPAVNPAYLENE